MSKFTEKAARFMRGRYGTDSLNQTIFWTYIALIVITAFTRLTVLSVIALALALIYLFRALSRNIARRSAENRRFLSICTAISGAARRLFKKGDPDHVFRRCGGCGVKLRLPHKRGRHTVRCPHCGKTFEVRIIF